MSFLLHNNRNNTTDSSGYFKYTREKTIFHSLNSSWRSSLLATLKTIGATLHDDDILSGDSFCVIFGFGIVVADQMIICCLIIGDNHFEIN